MEQRHSPVRVRHVATQRERQLVTAADPCLRRRARLGAMLGFTAAAILPVALWHDVIAGIASEFTFSLNYFVSQWTPFGLMLAGLVFLVPVALSAGSDPESRWYPRSRNAYAGWGTTLYLLGLLLALQVAQLYALHAG